MKSETKLLRPVVSVVVPVYNVEQYIERCMVSIQKQTYKDLEIIVVDDCTPDKSIDLVKNLQNNDDRLRIITHDKNLGLMRARQTGYKAATGDYITFCDSDDYLPEDAIESMYNESIKTKADIVSGNLKYIKSDGTSEIWSSTLNYGQDKHAAMKSLLMHELRHNLCSKLFKATLLQNYEYQTFDHFTNGEDGCLFYQVVLNMNKIVHIDKNVYYYMQNTESSSQVRYGDKAIKSICLLNKIRHESASVYEDLDYIRHNCITNILYTLYSQGYGFSTKLDNYIIENGLEGYKKLSLEYLGATELLKLCIKRYVQGALFYLKTLRK